MLSYTRMRIKGKKTAVKQSLLLGIFLFTIPSLFFMGFYLLNIEKIYPNIYLAEYHVGGKSLYDAQSFLSENLPSWEKITLVDQTTTPPTQFEIPLSSINFGFNLDDSTKNAFDFGRGPDILQNIENILNASLNPKTLKLKYYLNTNKLNEHLSTIAGQIAIDPVLPSVKLENNQIVIDPGKKGKDINIERIKQDINTNFSNGENNIIVVEAITVDHTLTSNEVRSFEKRVENIANKKLTFKFDTRVFEYFRETLLPLFWPTGGYEEKIISEEVEKITKEIEREPQNPVFNFQDGKVVEFSPAEDGITIEKDKLISLFIASLEDLEKNDNSEVLADIPTVTTKPTVNTEEVNSLGIKELIGSGISYFRGSIPSRVHNVSLAASRLNGILIPPGEEFSFNKALGDISKFTGFKEAYVIRDGKTVLGDGGGVCQVSTTLFRSALNAGLPIIERRGHSYRVGYYEQGFSPGLDATVYSPTTDFRFKNDTPGHILIQTKTDTKNPTLIFELYGTSDGRVATTTKPIITDSIAPPNDLYVDDPTLPSGQVKQIEHKAWGAKVRFDYQVKKGDEIVYEKTFITNYRPWGAVFMKGIGPIQ